MPTDDRRSPRGVLTRELSEFLVELSVALHRYSMYPSGHPSLGPVVDAIVNRAGRLFQDRSMIALGVARRQLIVDGVTTDPDQPVLRRLAEGLHRHHIGAVSIARGVQPQEFDYALRALASEADRSGPIGLKGDRRLLEWPHLALHPLTFDGLALVDDGAASGQGGNEAQASNDAELWVALARAALSGDGSGTEAVDTDPGTVARAIDDHAHAGAYDQVIVEYLFQIAHELKSASGENAEKLRKKTSQLVAALRPETLNRLVNMGGDRVRRSRFVFDATHGMAVDAVIEIVKAAAGASGQTISHGLVRMLSKLALHAEMGSDRARPRADAELREQVGRLLEDWDLQDPNPEAYSRVLQHLATTTQRHRVGLASEVTQAPEPVRLLQMSLESGAVGPLVERALDALVRAGQARAVTELLAARPDVEDSVADSLLTWLIRPSTIKALLAHEPLDVGSLDALLPRLPIEGYEYLLEALATSENRTTRRRLVDRLSRTEVDIGPLILKHLDDPRWYVQRNMLILLERAPQVPAGFSPAPWAGHPDPRVRCEAIRLQLRLPDEREGAILWALDDSDPRIVHLGLMAIQHACPEDLIPRILNLAVDADLDDDIRALAVNVVGKIDHPDVLPALLELTDGGRSLLGRIRLPLKSSVLLAAVRALSEVWTFDPRAAAVVVAAAESPDPDIRAAVQPPLS